MPATSRLTRSTDEPRSIGIVVHGFVPRRAERVSDALLLALGARAWQAPAFQQGSTKPSALKIVHLLGRRECLDTGRTLAEIDGANLVRWLTALPANKLSAAAYREVLAALAARHGWDFEWLGETAL